ncbi:MAG: MauE/DoxX family redox-associated membrane protein [Chitinophagales bacterium]
MAINIKTLLFHAIRIFVGVVFILSAIFKLLDIDVFELYIFSLQVFTFNISSVFARLIIGIELIIGVLLITNIHFKKIWLATVLLLTVFSIFLVVQIIKGYNENCHCFGEMLQLSPAESLIKNILLIGLLLIIKTKQEYTFKLASYVFLFVTTFSLVLPFVLSPPDFLIDYSQEGWDLNKVSTLIAENPTLDPLQPGSGKKMICMFSVTCQFCEKAAKKVSVMSNKYDLENNVIYIFTGDENNLGNFWEESDSQKFNYLFLPHKNFFRIAGPTVPSIYLSDNGKITRQFNYRSLDEKEIKTFFEDR